MANNPASITFPHGLAKVRLPESGWRQDLRAIKIVWRRELIRFSRDRIRVVTSLAQPIIYLFIFGTGLSRVVGRSAQGVDYRTFMFPGVLSMAVLFTALFSAISIVWDREFGFLREMLVAPIRRGSIVVGKCLGGATVATFQGLVMLCLAGLVDVPYSPLLIATLLAELLLLAFTLTAFGVMVSARMREVQSFMALTQMFVMPLFFLSGAMFPLIYLPTWLKFLTRIDPLTYAIDPMRRAIFDHLDVAPSATVALGAGVTWGSWRVPTLLELAMIAAMGLVMLVVAIVEFNETE
jgi:ABC-2 type transport system permease protein